MGLVLSLSSNNNTFVGNNFSKNADGCFIETINNKFYLNNFNNDVLVVNSAINAWNSPQPITYIYNGKMYTNYLGNYWSNYQGSETNGNGIGNTPYIIDGYNQDSYPLMKPFENYIVENKPPVVAFTCSPESPVAGETITFNALQSYDIDGYIVAYEWDFGDGGVEITAFPAITHSYNQAGSYTVKLTITDNDGATSTTSKVILVKSEEILTKQQIKQQIIGLIFEYMNAERDQRQQIKNQIIQLIFQYISLG